MVSRTKKIQGSVVLAAALLACASPAERLADSRRELREVLDDAYESYGGATAKDSEEKPRSAATRFLGHADRVHFEQYCLAYGRGERPFSLSEKTAAWVKEHERTCRKAADLTLRIEELEKKVEAP